MNKSLIKLLSFSAIALFSTSCGNNNVPQDGGDTGKDEPEVKKAQVVIMMGQSNMEGHTYHQYLSDTMPEMCEEFVAGYENTKISFACSINHNTSFKKFVPVKLGQGYDFSRFGPELGFAQKMKEENLDNVWIVKYAQGATALVNEWCPPSSGKTGSLFGGAIKYINQAMGIIEDEGFYPEIKAICWMQGEADSTLPKYLEYGDYLEKFITDLREELAYYSDPDGIGFVDAGISNCAAWTRYAEINKQKEEVSNLSELNTYFSTIEPGLKYDKEPYANPDIYHYDSDSMVRLGNLFAENTLKYLDK